MEPIGLGLKEAGRVLGGASRSTVYRLIDSGKLKKVKVGARSLVTMGSLKAYAAELEAA